MSCSKGIGRGTRALSLNHSIIFYSLKVCLGIPKYILMVRSGKFVGEKRGCQESAANLKEKTRSNSCGLPEENKGLPE